MISWNQLSGARRLSDRYKDLFKGRACSYNNLVALVCYFIFGSKSLSEFVRCHPWSHSVSDLSRAVNSFHSPRWMRRMRKSILKKCKDLNKEDYCLALDDTDNPKFGAGVYNAGYWHGSKGLYYGQRVVVLVLVNLNTGIALPLAYRIAAKEDSQDFATANDLGVAMLSELKSEGYGSDLHVVCDSWFDGVEFVENVCSLGYNLVWELKSNRNVWSNPGRWVGATKLQKLFKHQKKSRLRHRLECYKIRNRKLKGKSGAYLRILIDKYSKMLGCVAVYNRRNGSKAFAYWASTDLSLTAERIWELSRGRWKIECMFRDLKQNLSFGRLPCASKEAADLSICLPFIIYTSLRLDYAHWGCEANQSIGKMIAILRDQALCQAISKITDPTEKSKIIRFSARRSKERVCKKPVNRSAERSDFKKAS